MIREILRKAAGESTLGGLEFFRRPATRKSWGGPFNGQRFRQRIFFDLLYYFPIQAIVETGTYRGTTTALFAATSLPVYTSEIAPRFFSYSKVRFLLNRDNIHMYKSDSRAFLRDLSKDSTVPKEDVFFYLDAHWEEDLPLREELDIIFSNWKRPIVMIDDFQVPDSDYVFDNYGPEKALTLEYINPLVSAHKLSVFYPAVQSSEETGARTGSVVLCEETSGSKVDEDVKTLARRTPHLQVAVG